MAAERANESRGWARWDAYWFGAESPFDLGVARAIFCGVLFWFVAGLDYGAWVELPQIFWIPHGFFAWSGLEPPSAAVLRVLQLLWKAALLASCIGLFTRASLAVSFGLSPLFLYLPHNYAAKLGHGEGLAVFVLLILLASRSGDAFSLDAWRRRAAPAPEPSGRYRWPLRAVWLITALVLASAGAAKMEIGGPGWISSDNMTALLLQHHYYFTGHAPTRWGLYLAQSEVVTFALALVTVVVELGMPLALLHWKLRAVLVPASFLMLCGFALLLGPVFYLLLATYAFWVPWERLANRLGGRSPAEPVRTSRSAARSAG